MLEFKRNRLIDSEAYGDFPCLPERPVPPAPLWKLAVKTFALTIAAVALLTVIVRMVV